MCDKKLMKGVMKYDTLSTTTCSHKVDYGKAGERFQPNYPYYPSFKRTFMRISATAF